MTYPTKKLGDVRYNILLKDRNAYYKISKIIIRKFSGDIFYIPSHKKLKSDTIDKISWHASGRVHFKMQNGKYFYVQHRQSIQNTGFQEVVRDTILDFQKLPQLSKSPHSLDVIFKVDDYHGPVQFIFSVVSGRLIVAQYEGKKIPIKRVEDEIKDELFGIVQRGLGYESDNADKLLQYFLVKYIGDKDLPSGRRIFVPDNSQISRYV